MFDELFHFIGSSLWPGLYIGPQGRAKAFLHPELQAEPPCLEA
jgi:hypothetical protein